MLKSLTNESLRKWMVFSLNESYLVLMIKLITQMKFFIFWLWSSKVVHGTDKRFCYTSQLKYVFRLEENMLRVMGKTY